MKNPSAALFKKPCVKCGVVDRDKTGRCRGCTRDTYAAHPEPCLARGAAWRGANPEKHAIVQRTWRRANPDKAQVTYVRSQLRRYGLTAVAHDALLARQRGVCAICSLPGAASGSGRAARLCVDHDHRCCSGNRSCGKCVRGLLCRSCNAGLGQFKENSLNLRMAAAYLDMPKTIAASSAVQGSGGPSA